MTAKDERTAQAIYADMLRLQIGPRLRALGFTGSGASYVLRDDERWLIVGFQKDRYSTAAIVRFTVNLTAADKRAWAKAHAEQQWLPARPSGNARYPVGETIRLGGLMPPGLDHWWAVEASHASNSAAAQVIEAIEFFALPWLRSGNPADSRDIRAR